MNIHEYIIIVFINCFYLGMEYPLSVLDERSVVELSQSAETGSSHHTGTLSAYKRMLEAVKFGKEGEYAPVFIICCVF